MINYYSYFIGMFFKLTHHRLYCIVDYFIIKGLNDEIPISIIGTDLVFIEPGLMVAIRSDFVLGMSEDGKNTRFLKSEKSDFYAYQMELKNDGG
jgi:hypothetical protein